MRKSFSKIALAATIVFALVFTFSCSSDSSNDGEVSYDETAQIYNPDGSLYNGNGSIELYTGANAGKVTNGIAQLKLPETVSHLRDFMEVLEEFEYYNEEGSTCNYPEGIKAGGGWFFHNNRYLTILYKDKQTSEGIYYLYFSKAGKITCSSESSVLDIDVKAGWNKIYFRENRNEGGELFSTNNVLTREARWTIYDF